MTYENLTIKDLHTDDRPMEKLLKYGVQALSNTELLAILIGSGVRGKNALELSNDILGKIFSQKQLLFSSVEELMEIKGIGLAKATRIVSGLELGKRLSMIDSFDKISFSNPDTVANYFFKHYLNSNREEFTTMLLDTKNKIISLETISIGTINTTIVHPREVFREAVKKGANSIILVHNHPSGDPSPSKEDILITNRLIEAGKIIGISVLDHIIIGDNRYISMKQKKII